MSIKTPLHADKIIGSNIRRLRVERGMSQEKLGDALDLTFQQVQKYEKGTNRVGGSRLVQISEVLGVPIQALFEGIRANNGTLAKPSDVLRMGESQSGVVLARSFHALAGYPTIRKHMINAFEAIADRAQKGTL